MEIAKLPKEIVNVILLFIVDYSLPSIEFICSLRTVCKLFKTLIDSQTFTESYLESKNYFKCYIIQDMLSAFEIQKSRVRDFRKNLTLIDSSNEDEFQFPFRVEMMRVTINNNQYAAFGVKYHDQISEKLDFKLSLNHGSLHYIKYGIGRDSLHTANFARKGIYKPISYDDHELKAIQHYKGYKYMIDILDQNFSFIIQTDGLTWDLYSIFEFSYNPISIACLYTNFGEKTFIYTLHPNYKNGVFVQNLSTRFNSEVIKLDFNLKTFTTHRLGPVLIFLFQREDENASKSIYLIHKSNPLKLLYWRDLQMEIQYVYEWRLYADRIRSKFGEIIIYDYETDELIMTMFAQVHKINLKQFFM